MSGTLRTAPLNETAPLEALMDRTVEQHRIVRPLGRGGMATVSCPSAPRCACRRSSVPGRQS